MSENRPANPSPSTVRVSLQTEGDDSDLARALSPLAQTTAESLEATVEHRAPELRDLPALVLSTDQTGTIAYSALPEGPEQAPFDELVQSMLSTASHQASWAKDLTRLEQPAELLVFIAPTCPHCPQAVRAANQLALASHHIRTHIIDVMRAETLAQSFQVQSVPLTVLDGELSLIGVVPARDLAAHVLARGSSEHQRKVLESLIDGQRLSAAGQYLRDQPMALVDAWRTSTTSKRMGLMLAAGEALDEDEIALDSIVPALTTLLETDDVALCGDTADLLGQIGHTAAQKPLERLLHASNPDLVEVAEDALEQITERMG